MARHSITSVSNARLKAIRRLRRRGGDGVFLVEGYRQLLHALERRAEVLEVYAAPRLFLGTAERPLLERAEAAGAEIVEVGEEAFASIAGRARPDGLLALVRRWPAMLVDLTLPRAPLVLVADSIERPGNLGTIVRTACGAGADAVVACGACADLFHPDTVAGSVGALFHVPVARASVAEALDWTGAHGFRLVVASPGAGRRYWECDVDGPLALVVGSERHGVSKPFLDAADDVVEIPMGRGVDSLNVAVATGVVLFEIARRRGYPRTSAGVSSAGLAITASARASASAAGG